MTIRYATIWQNARSFLSKYQKDGKNLFWSNSNQISVTFFSLLLSVVFARFGGKEVYGQYLFLISIIGLFSLFAVPGFRTVIIRSVSQGYEGVYQKGTRIGFLWSILGVPVITTIGLYYYIYNNHVLGIALIACAFLTPFYNSLQTWSAYLKGRRMFKQLFWFNFYQLLLHTILVSGALVWQNSFIN